MLRIRRVTNDDFTNISVLVVNAFGQPNESRLITALRTTGAMAIELVAEDDEGMVGHLAMSRFDSPENWVALAPISVRPESQGIGVGRSLVRYALDEARRSKFDAVVVVGSPGYYGKMGFVFNGPAKLSSPYPQEYTGFYPLSPKVAMTSASLSYPQPFSDV
ncbi:GNAT family N-acetyltransferase [Pseudoruegeria sp. SK021]|uniref:GNAT family N-acetyltransferase n=1 Tax=Pseudoruegeria sp. SK021 TaxID=1933035 RepID=UPI000A2628B5|nr:N-acetyltransferase [Pseudoruegeria sp. SK021]OSP54157.1 hypothetical protein BV911_13960 [Pseudoruegeria sp. SK021]